ncbi:MAG: ATP-binding protein [Bacilli bacterium]|nr:ATP-binding protein [Bacilli bacterium]
MNYVNVTITILDIAYLTFLMFIYFSKKNMPNIENKIYKVILVLSLFVTVSDLVFWSSCFYLKDTPYIVEIMQKIYLTFLLFWEVYLIYYIVLVTNPNSKLVKNYLGINGRISIYPNIVALILSAIQFFLPLGFEKGNDGVLLYADGPIYGFIVMVTLGLAVIAFLSVFIGRHNITVKKTTPLIVFTIYESIIFYIFIQNHTICAWSLSCTLTSYLMFHTIENPDLKLINELELAKTSAEKANNAKSDFLASMSHELRTPLNAIMGLTQLIEKNDNVDQIHEDTKDIMLASENLLELVDGILDINKLETNKMELVEGNYNPIEVFDDLVRMIKVIIGERPLELRTKFSNNLPLELYGDKDKVKRIITNFLTNAVKYTDKGYIDFIVDCYNEKERCNLVISIKDTGRGIRDDQKQVLFTKFNRREEDKDTDIEGTGLGLALTKSLVEMMEGKIEVESTYGEGSTFTVKITQKIIRGPVEFKHEESSVGVESRTINQEEVLREKVINTNVGSEKVKLLVVDDNKLNLRVASKLLSALNFDVSTVNSGIECINKINNGETYNLIFMDIMMPEMDGIETMKKLKEMGFSSPIVALTADAMEGSREKYLSAGFDDYLSKPIDQMTISETLEKFLKLKVISQEDADNRRNNYIEPDDNTSSSKDVEIL